MTRLNLLNNGSKKKKWIIGGITAFVILLLTLVIVFWGDITQIFKKDDGSIVEEQENTGGGSNSQDTGFNLDSDKDYSALNILIPTEVSEGVVKEYTDAITMAELIMTTDKGDKTYSITTKSIIFDAKTNKILLPSSLSNVKDVRVLSTSKDTEVSDAAVVVLNSKDNLHYTPTLEMAKTGEAIYIINPITKTQYKVKNNTRMTNAFSGRAYTEEELELGDRLFIYEGEAKEADKGSVPEEDDFMLPDELVSKEKENESIKKVKEKDLPKGYKTVDVSELLIFPKQVQR